MVRIRSATEQLGDFLLRFANFCVALIVLRAIMLALGFKFINIYVVDEVIYWLKDIFVMLMHTLFGLGGNLMPMN